MKTPSILQVEQHGVDAVPTQERTKTWWDLFVIRAGTNMTLPIFLVGALLVPSFSPGEAFFVLVTGNLILALLLSTMAYYGVDHGIPVSVASRFSMGYPKGVWVPSLSIVFSLVGWFAITTELAGLAVDQIIGDLAGMSAPTLFITLMGLSSAGPAIFGFENIKWLSRLSVPFLLALACWMLVAILRENPFSSLTSYDPTGEAPLGTGLDWVIGGLIVGVFIAPDTSRYLRSRRDTWIGCVMGILPTGVFLSGIGAVSKLATGDWNPIHAVDQLGLGIPALIVIVFATWTTMDTSLYSAGLALTSILTQFSRWQNTLLLSLIGTALAVFRVTEYFRDFLLLLSNVFSPLVGILICDYFLIRKKELPLADVYQPQGFFHYHRGVNWVAIVATIIGFIVARYTPPVYVSSLTALASGMLSYYLGMRIFYRHHFQTG